MQLLVPVRRSQIPPKDKLPNGANGEGECIIDYPTSPWKRFSQAALLVRRRHPASRLTVTSSAAVATSPDPTAPRGVARRAWFSLLVRAMNSGSSSASSQAKRRKKRNDKKGRRHHRRIGHQGRRIRVPQATDRGSGRRNPDDRRRHIRRAALRPGHFGSGGGDGGGADRAALAAANDRGNAVGAMAAGAAIILKRLYDEGRVHGAIAMGGGGGRQARLLRKAARDGRARSEGDVRRCRKGWRQASDGVQLALLPRRADCKEDGRRRNARPHLRFPRSVAWRTLTSRSGRSSPPSLRLRARWSART